MTKRNQLIWNNVAAPGTPNRYAGWDAEGNPVEKEGASESYTFGNGLTEQDGDVWLGGQLNQATTIDAAGQAFTIENHGSLIFADSQGAGTYFNDFAGGGTYFNDFGGGGFFVNDYGGGGIFMETDGGGITINETSSFGGISLTDSGGGISLLSQGTEGASIILNTMNNFGEGVSISLSQDNFVIGDSRSNAKGIEYQADYSANYNDRSIPDVAYVNSRTSPGGGNQSIQYNNNGVFGGFGEWTGFMARIPGNVFGYGNFNLYATPFVIPTAIGLIPRCTVEDWTNGEIEGGVSGSWGKTSPWLQNGGSLTIMAFIDGVAQDFSEGYSACIMGKFVRSGDNTTMIGTVQKLFEQKSNVGGDSDMEDPSNSGSFYINFDSGQAIKQYNWKIMTLYTYAHYS